MMARKGRELEGRDGSGIRIIMKEKEWNKKERSECKDFWVNRGRYAKKTYNDCEFGWICFEIIKEQWTF